MESPEFLAARNKACEKKFRGWLYGGDYVEAASKDKVGETLEQIERDRKRLMEKHEGYMRQADLARIMANPHVRQITEASREASRRKHGSGGLVCPVCGEGDHGNRANGKPVCYMNSKHKAKGVDGPVPLMSPEKAKDWSPPPKKFKRTEPWELDDSELVKARGRKKRRK